MDNDVYGRDFTLLHYSNSSLRSSAHCSSLRSSQVRGIYGGVVADWLSRGYDLDEGTIERGLEELKAIGAVDVEKKEWEVSGGAKISQQIIHIFLTRFL